MHLYQQWCSRIILLFCIFSFSFCQRSKPSDTCSGGQCSSKTRLTKLERALQNFSAIHEHMVTLAQNHETRGSARFVVFKVCCGELGNRLLALTSSLLVALLTGRGLLIGNESLYVEECFLDTVNMHLHNSLFIQPTPGSWQGPSPISSRHFLDFGAIPAMRLHAKSEF
jgi:hypothetical protein